MINRITVIYHSADFDGIFCREIAKKFLGTDGVDYIGWDFGDKPLPIPSEGTIYVMDLPVDRVFDLPINDGHYRRWLERTIWIDHHKTSIDTHPESIPGYRIDGVAACRLAWQWFENNRKLLWNGSNGERIGNPNLPTKQDFIDRKVTEPYAVQLAGEYDIWDKRNPNVDLFQNGLKSVEPIDFNRLLNEDTVKSFLPAQEIVEFGRLVNQFIVNQNAVIMKRTAHHRKWKGINFLVANLAIGNSQTFDSAVTPETEALMMWRHDGEKVHVSLYGCKNKPDIDLSITAKQMGGGGHKQACGFTIGLSDFVTSVLYSGGEEAVAV